jgi:hypothetical protein
MAIEPPDPAVHAARYVKGKTELRLSDQLGNEALRGIRWFKVDASWKPEDVVKALGRIDRNEVDELVVRNDSGVYVLYADSLPKDLAKGGRFESDEVSGEILAVFRDKAPKKKQAKKAQDDANKELDDANDQDHFWNPGPLGLMRSAMRNQFQRVTGDPTLGVQRDFGAYERLRSPFDPKNALTPPKARSPLTGG